ncbi:MAG: diguanylate cyclase [Candidatus Dadabacteria bacterium]|nr:diguanylate cyclase [Candidatus Dadabacteria bacterium]NIQ14080.1 diguanylate cyclase [Candidatus Dadabacteria bacterium]
MDTLDTIMAQEFVCFSVKKGNQSDILLTSSEDVILTNKSFFHAQSLVGLVSDSNKSLSFPDISERSKHRDVFNKEIDLALGIKSIKSALIFPISTSDDKKEDIFGATFIGRTQKYEFNEEQRQLSRILIQQAAKAIRYSTNVKEIKELAIKDGLSGLYNHRHFKELFSNIISRALRYPEKVSLILIDFDNFKQINDEYGHLAGDKIIKEIGKTIMESTRDIDISARYGGDEFAILLPNTNDHGSVVVANKIKSGFKNKEIIYNDVEIQAKFSVGIATFPDDAETIDQLFKKADSALYEAKRMGKDIILHSKEMINEKVISDKTH